MFKRKKKLSVKQETKRKDFRVTIFGSARLRKKDKEFQEVYKLAKIIGEHGFDIVTGGGPGLMEAANAGHEEGDKLHKSDSIGLIIKLPWENKGNKHLEIKTEYKTFARRLQTFMKLSSVLVIVPGGIGTCLELFYSLQLIQVGHIKPVPIIVVGKMWEELIVWMKKYPLKKGLISSKDMDHIHIAKNNKETMKMILEAEKKHRKKHN